MNEDAIAEYCKDLILSCNEKNLGAFIVLIDDDGLVSVNRFPSWSVLQHSDKTDKIVLSKNESDTPQEWFHKCENTLHFLAALTERCLEMSEMCNTLRSALLEAIEESFGKEIFTEKVLSCTTETLH